MSNDARHSPAVIAVTILIGVGLAATPAPGQMNDNQKRMHGEAWQSALKYKLIEGVRGVELIRPDLLELRLDWGVVGEVDPAGIDIPVEGPPDVFEAPARYRISSPTDPAYAEPVQPKRVSRVSYEAHNWWDGKTNWPLFVNIIHWHDMYLVLPSPMKSGHTYRIEVVANARVDGITYDARLKYDDRATVTKAIKINQVGYSALASRRYAYLGWWAGKAGAVDYGGFDGKPFIVVDENTGEDVLTGTIALRRKDDKNSGEDIYELDISALQVGTYHIAVPGLARSHAFRVGGAGTHALYYHAMRGFFHQRCGQKLGPPYTWVERPACHTAVWESGVPAEGYIMAHGDPEPYPPKPGEQQRSYVGGYHDAADFDSFTYHLPATMEILAVYDRLAEQFADGDLDLPESGNGLPDLLDEAEWGLKVYLALQRDDGAVPLGRIHMCDSLKQNFEVEKGPVEDKPQPAFGVIPPTRNSTEMFAAAAAQFARLIEPYDAAKAKLYLDAAERAFEHARTHRYVDMVNAYNEAGANPKMLTRNAEKADQARESALTLAAAHLARATGEAKYRQFLADHSSAIGDWRWRDERWAAIASADLEAVGENVWKLTRNSLVQWADKLVAATEEGGYRMGNGNGTQCGWGAAQGANHGPLLIQAYLVTGEQKYLDAACLNADFHLGANPLGRCSLTGMGFNPPRRPEISYYLYTRMVDGDLQGDQVKGIGIYGIGPPLKFEDGTRWPLWRSWRDVWGRYAEIYSEFTVHQTIGPSATLYSALYALERQRGLIPADLPKIDPATKP